MEKTSFKFLDSSEARYWDVLKAAGIKFTASEEMYDPLRKTLVKVPGVHHYDICEFYDTYKNQYHSLEWDGLSEMADAARPAVRAGSSACARSAMTFNEQIQQMKNQSCQQEQKPKKAPLGQKLTFQDQTMYDDMPNLRHGNLEIKPGGELDTMGKLDDLDNRARELEKELSILSDKITTFFYEATKTTQEAAEATCQWNTLAGTKCNNGADLIKKIGQRFDEKLAALRLHLNENRVNTILDELEAKVVETQRFAKKVVNEIKKLA